MEKNEIIAKIKEILLESMDIPEDKVQDDSSFMDDLELSSLEILDLVTQLEDEYHISLEEKELRNMIYVDELAEYIQKLLECNDE